ncbi:four helix bundle protein [Aliifodinibius salicampi]|uniref:Four helix bundle protein n=1 Tax=Fodinibius salicampi TaxID=1920655 RepID=A0ABT3Q0T2_9BACT|nr:four helix bundle protein [Fodinibius salicampi]MCW9713719.1 four helix bundle protein [Fodinibius salicampi]
MKRENIVQKKSYDFALRIIHLYQLIIEGSKEYILAKQVLKSGTSIGANIEEAIGAQSRKDFKAKLSISYKKPGNPLLTSNTSDSKIIEDQLSQSLINDCEELLKIIGSIIKTLKNSHS